MQAHYRDLTVNRRGGGLELKATVENRSAETWSSDRGDALSYQIYDADSEALLLEGGRSALAGDTRPGEQAELTLEIELPAEAGRFQVFVAMLREGGSWSFESGSPFLLLDAEVTANGPRLLGRRQTTLRKLAARRLWRSLGRAFVYPLRAIVEHRSLVRSMVRRDIAGRYAGSYAGAFWTLIHPLMMMLTYTFVFGVVLQTRWGDDGRPSNFVLYFLAGMLPWLAFSEAAGRAPTVILEHANFVKKLVFPVEILPLNLVFAGLFTELFGIAMFVLAMLGFGREPSATALLLPLLLVPQILLTMGTAWFLAALGVVFRDLGQLIGFLLTIWFFTTPICYPEASLPQNFLWLFELNPLYVLVSAYRAVLLDGAAPDWSSFGLLTAGSAAWFVLGHAWFYKLKKSFADMV